MSSTIDQLLNKGMEMLPANVGPVFDTVLGVGSLVSSGMDAYKSIKQEFDQIKRFLKRFTNLKDDPQALFYLINSILRENPVKLPDYALDKNSINMLKKIIKGDFDVIKNGGIVGEGPYVTRSSLYNEGVISLKRNKLGQIEDGDPVGVAESDMKAIPLPKDIGDRKRVSTYGIELQGEQSLQEGEQTINFDSPFNTDGNMGTRNESKYMAHTNPYGQSEVKILDTPMAVMNYINDELKASFGYKKWAGYELGTDHQWDIQIKPYVGPDGITFTPEFPKYGLPQIGVDSNKNEDMLNVREFDFGLNCPCIAYNLQFGTQVTRDVPLYNESRFLFTTGFGYNMLLSLSIADDVYRSMYKYMNKYMNSTYDIETNSVAPYNQSAFEITLMVFRAGYQMNYMTKLIGIPLNYNPNLSGQDQPNEARLDIDFSIVGIVSPESGEMELPEAGEMLDGEWKSTKWNQVLLSPI